MDWNLTTFHFKIKTWIQVNWEKCGSGGALFCIGSVFFFPFSLQASKNKKKKYVKSCAHIHTHTMGDRKRIERSAVYPSEAIVPSVEHQSIRCRPQGRCVGMCERRCVGKEAVRQADWPDPSRGNHQYLKHFSSLPPFFRLIHLISNPPFSSLLVFLLLFYPSPLLFCTASVASRNLFSSPVLFSTSSLFFILLPFCYCLLILHFCLQKWMVHCAHLSLLAVTPFFFFFCHLHIVCLYLPCL